jgi:hypothetical protein
MGGRVNLTERFAKAARADGRKSRIFYDDGVIGFGLQVRDNGRKAFTLGIDLTAASGLQSSRAIGPLSATFGQHTYERCTL